MKLSQPAEPTPAARDWEKITLLAFGTFFFIVLLAIAWLDRHPSKSSLYIYICVLAMAAGGIAALLPGALDVDLDPGIRAGGALALAVLVIYFGKGLAADDLTVQSFKSHLDSQGFVIDPASDVYVEINSKLALYSSGGFSAKNLNFGDKDWKGTKHVTIQRGPGGIQVNYGALTQGDTILVISKDRNGGWSISNDVVVPESELAMKNYPIEAIKARIENGE